MLLFVVILWVFCTIIGAVFFRMELSIENDRLRWLEERLTKLEKDAVKITFTPPFTTGDDVIVHPDVKVTPPPKKRKPKSVKDWEDNFDLGGHE
jgi:hypothetical protein